ncbi:MULTISPECIES: hypothetical protein [Peptoniphilus]|uniref:hypothetical protein n=1 Tax=Peptoniphilus TaxID=162289 RepID=UPI0001DA9CA6|nr:MULTISPECIES: hypothetical protein [Peptoniphilus]EFI42454.1 hypothetical protein HMPREF0629_01104 [Peptoniphilus sp. oral taxon 386 str. F0131]
MKKIIFDMSPLGNFSPSCKAYYTYYNEKFSRKIFFYTRCDDGTYLRVDELENEEELKNRIITFKDLGQRVCEIPFNDDIRVPPIDESFEDDDILKRIVERLGDKASWKNSELRLIEVEDEF